MERIYRLDRDVIPCGSCQRQPKAVLRFGKNTHRLECCNCESRTAPHPSLAEAIAAWERQESAPVVIKQRARLSLAR